MSQDMSRIQAMMDGKTLEKENILKMYRMVQSAADTEEKKSVMKHSVFFVGQLPLKDGYRVDLPATRRILNTTVPYEELEEYMNYLLDGLTTQTLLLKNNKGDYEVNMKYEKSISKVKKIAYAYQAEKEEAYKEIMPKVKKMYQMGTKYYNAGSYEEAAASFMNTIEMAEYRMGYYSLALMYYEGKGVEQSYEKALYYARNAIIRGARIAEGLEENILEQLEG
ncbi:MAG: hypothetical protein IKX76_00050 [Eubacterium sp.]|nr:hypothetical protein [Eubacterium sp.]